jgi:hypothetical protein
LSKLLHEVAVKQTRGGISRRKRRISGRKRRISGRKRRRHSQT